MKLFFILVRKEVRELLTLQMLVPFLIMVGVFIVLGNVSRSEIEKSQQPQPLIVLDQDQSAESSTFVSLLSQGPFEMKPAESTTLDDVLSQARLQDINMVAVVPTDYSEKLSQLQAPTIETYALMNSFSFGSSQQYAMLSASIQAISQQMSDQLISERVQGVTPTQLKSPLSIEDHVVINKNVAQVSTGEILGYVTSQANFIPLIMFMVIVMSSQMIASAIAAEKENKTLETLLSTPVSRAMIVSAKMVGAGLVALLLAIAYMFGFQSYINGISGGELSLSSSSSMQDAIEALGLTLGTTDYMLIGLSLFFAILCALAISIILGSFAEDVKAVQGVITPLMVFVLFAYFSSVFLDVYSAAPMLRYALLAVPFTHPFQAVPNIFLGRPEYVVYGILYELVVFLLFVGIAARIFSSDKIFSMKFSLPKRS